ncbi:MAG: dockerin type I domain-containing protein [Planctomycetota bacterium]
MSSAVEPSNDDDTLATPQLARALRAHYRAPSEVTAEIDRRVLADANRRLRLVRWGRATRWISGGAAALLVIGGVYLAVERATRTPALDDRRSTALRADIDGSGRVDILDALRLARLVAETPVVDRRFDMNSDTVVDQRDVDAVAERAVRLEKRERP